MPEWLLLDELHLSFLVPPTMSEPAAIAARDEVASADFQRALQRWLQSECRKRPALHDVKIRKSF